MSGLLGKKVGMTSVFTEEGANVAVTVIEVEPCVITQVKTEDSDGYNAVQIAQGEKSEKNTTKALNGHFAKANTTPKRYIKEIRDFVPEDASIGDSLGITDVFEENNYVDVVGYSKGKGFQGVVKRHGFSGVGEATHGQKDRERGPGSIGQMSDPSRVWKGLRMAGRTGHNRTTTKHLQVVKIMSESNLLMVKGTVPGPKGEIVEIHNNERQR